MLRMKTYISSVVILIVLYFQTSFVDASSLIAAGRLNLGDFPAETSSLPSYLQEDGEKDGKDHPCHRPCDGTSRTCYYHFQVEWYQSMSKACFDCPFNLTDCEKKDCVVADGLSRQITTINRKIPGPTIEVCQHDRVIVNLTNDLGGAETAIHWHGMHQRGTPYMDGVPFVTQCPVVPENSFTYDFVAAQAGTQFWHAHIGLQRGDGISGALVVRKPKTQELYRHLYQFDKSDHLIQIQDWADRTAQSVYTGHYHAKGGMAPTSLLINGRGKFEVKDDTGRTAWTKPPRFEASRFRKYRFRIVNEGFSFCPVEVSVDGHNITIIATDGYYLEPVVARSLVTFAGERFDFILYTDKKVDNYWIKFRGVLNCVNNPRVRQVAVLHYRDAAGDEPSGPLVWEPRINDEMLINPENQGEENVTTTITKLHYMKTSTHDDALKAVPDYKFYIAYDLYLKDNELFNKPPSYGHKQVNKDYSVPTPQLNHISMKLPNSPVIVSRPPASAFCNESSFPEGVCKDTFCRCHHILSVKLNSIVEVILIDEGAYTNANHPFHLHGHSFRVVGQRRLGEQTTAEAVKDLDRAGKIARNLLDNPPYKDTVTVPDGGYTIIRFKASNPGYWLFHCHIEFHAEVGMALAFKVGEHEEMPPVPQGFPTCGNFVSGGSSSNGGGGSGLVNPFGLENIPVNPQPGSASNNVYARVLQQYNAYHSVMQMPMGGQMEIVYRPPQTGS